MADTTEVPIAPPPGVVKTDATRAVEGRYSDTINIRFVKGFAQKIGGWVKAFSSATMGVPRTLHAWRDKAFNAFFAVGTYIKLYCYDTAGAQNDITPYRLTGTLGTNPFTTTLGSTIVQVAHTAHGLSPGDLIYLSGSTAVGGITPAANGTPVQTVIDANNYTFDNGAPAATSGATGGGSAVTFKYEIPVGVEIGTYGYGWGVGGWGLGTWGTARTSSTIVIEPRVWSLDHFGTTLLAAYNGGTIYQFDPTQQEPWPRASLASSDPGMPTNCRAMFVTPERYVFALADGLQVYWCNQSDYTVWTPASNNTANIRTLTEGSKLVGGKVLSDFVSLVWTDAALYRFQYTGATYIYASSMVGKDCGLVSPNAAVTAGGIAYWMGQDNFWFYNGSVAPMPNVDDIRKWVYDQFDSSMSYQANATFSPTYDEIFFFFTPVGQTDPTLGLIFSIPMQCWAPLYWGRAGGAHYTQGDTRPYFGGTDLNIYQHENGLDAAGAALPWSTTLAPYGLTKGGKYNMEVEYLVPDFYQQTGDISMTLNAYDRVNDTAPMDTETETIAAAGNTGTIDTRISGRYIGVTFGSSSLGCYARLGVPVAFVKPIGTRS